MSAIVSDAILISLNGEGRRVAAGLTVAGLLQQIGLDRRKVAVELNQEIVTRSTYAETRLAQGDKLEIVHFIGGG
jgi:thiamine biosynthesis protein ThiS